MKIQQLHDWQVSPAQAVRIQNELRARVSTHSTLADVQTVVGVDISVRGTTAKAAAVALRYSDMHILDVAVVEQQATFPYVPGLLSFRESPSILEALTRLSVQPQLIIADGQGLAHPRRFGIASHLGLLVDTPTIGCAKTRLCGWHDDPEPQAGSYAHLYDHDELIGAVVRTRDKVNPVFVSVGHKVDLDSAIQHVLACCRGYRLPEPTRQAHNAAGGTLKWDRSAARPQQPSLFG